MRMVEQLIISPNKGLLKGECLIDDNVVGKGQENFEGQLIQFGCGIASSWKSVLVYLGV